MRFLEFAHVNGDEIVLATIECFGQRKCGLGFADATRTGHQEHTDWFAGIIKLGARCLNSPRDSFEPMSLPDNAFFEIVREIQDRLNFVLHHSTNRNSSPVRDHRGNSLLIDAGKNERRLSLKRSQFLFESLKVGQQLSFVFRRTRLLFSGSRGCGTWFSAISIRGRAKFCA